jgi:uncharacterized protein YunC (DUF1805 family)
MKLILKAVLLLATLASTGAWADESSVVSLFDWSDLDKKEIALEAPLLIVKGSSGFLACGYINTDTCNKTGEACAVVSGVNTHEDMLEAKVGTVSVEASKLGVKVGMSGAEALELFR